MLPSDSRKASPWHSLGTLFSAPLALCHSAPKVPHSSRLTVTLRDVQIRLNEWSQMSKEVEKLELLEAKSQKISENLPFITENSSSQPWQSLSSASRHTNVTQNFFKLPEKRVGSIWLSLHRADLSPASSLSNAFHLYKKTSEYSSSLANLYSR